MLRLGLKTLEKGCSVNQVPRVSPAWCDCLMTRAVTHGDLLPQSLCCVLHVAGLGSHLGLQNICWGNQISFCLSPCQKSVLGEL